MGLLKKIGSAIGRVVRTLIGPPPEIRLPKPPPLPEQAMFARTDRRFRKRRTGTRGTLLTGPLGLTGGTTTGVDRLTLLGQ